MNCTSCGKQLNPGARFCNACGAAQNTGAAPMPGQPQQPVNMKQDSQNMKQDPQKLLILALGVGLVVVIVIFFILNGNNNDAGAAATAPPAEVAAPPAGITAPPAEVTAPPAASQIIGEWRLISLRDPGVTPPPIRSWHTGWSYMEKFFVTDGTGEPQMVFVDGTSVSKVFFADGTGVSRWNSPQSGWHDILGWRWSATPIGEEFLFITYTELNFDVLEHYLGSDATTDILVRLEPSYIEYSIAGNILTIRRRQGLFESTYQRN